MTSKRFVFSMPRRAPRLDIDVGRRRLLAAGTASAAALVLPDAFAQALSCVVTPDSGEGPFYFDPSLVRSDVTSGRHGRAARRRRADHARARLRAAAPACASISGRPTRSASTRAIATSPASAASTPRRTAGATFLRGTQLTDRDGWVRFKTVYPSWYGGRTPHLHFKVFVDCEGSDRDARSSSTTRSTPRSSTTGIRIASTSRKRTSFNNNDTFLDRDNDGRIDGLFCEVEKYDRAAASRRKPS